MTSFTYSKKGFGVGILFLKKYMLTKIISFVLNKKS